MLSLSPPLEGSLHENLLEFKKGPFESSHVNKCGSVRTLHVFRKASGLPTREGFVSSLGAHFLTYVLVFPIAPTPFPTYVFSIVQSRQKASAPTPLFCALRKLYKM
uniref:Ovule protein n=1 Tax=Steinernema glaseri TaxID=37863 RepID=A0A1I7ZUP9_9BILA